MSPLARAHPSHLLPIYTTLLAWTFVALCALGGIFAVVVGGDNHPMVAAAILLAGAALVAAGWFAARTGSRWTAVALVTAGAIIVGAVFFWTVLATVLAIALIVLFVMHARRGSPAAVRPAV